MDRLFPSVQLYILSGIVVGLSTVYFLKSRKSSNLPPGPPRKPIIGNALDFDSLRPWHRFAEWRDQYGDIVYAEALGKPMIILNTLEVTNDLLEKRASNFTNRPNLVVVGEMMRVNEGMAMLPYGPAWRKQRRLVNIGLSITAVKKYHLLQSQITAMFLQSLVERPRKYADELRLAAGRIVISVTYGLSAKTPDDLYITEAEECLGIVTRGSMPGAFMVDLIPALRHLPSWFPGVTFHKAGKEGREKIQRLVTRPFNYVKSQMEAGTARPSLALDCLENYESLNEKATSVEEKEHTIRWATGVMYAAGGETTYTTVLNFILACLDPFALYSRINTNAKPPGVKYPRVLKKAQAEYDSVIGGGRLPTIDDRASLPFISACVKEAARWHVALPIARETSEEEEYRGYYIPKNTIVIPNVWCMAQDTVSGIPTEDFAPERHMPEYVGDKVATDPTKFAFGFGRRVCPGRFLGENSVFLLIASIIATMDITPEQDAQGNDINPNPEYAGGLVAHPKPFPVKITPRSQNVSAMVADIVNSIEDFDKH
ncbi:hypothetical protein VNI00_001193 [Paramarasmius palmivorus]|uniref:Cytochrome P450 n=1 Tax=Paramarasmius palmivorus TaxID=297713 RepID=A0AAW0E5B1_9AGAR